MSAIDYQSVRDYSLFVYNKGEDIFPYDDFFLEYPEDDPRRALKALTLPPDIVGALQCASISWWYEKDFERYCRKHPTVEDWSAYFQLMGRGKPVGALLPARFAALAARRAEDPRLFERELFALWFEARAKYGIRTFSPEEDLEAAAEAQYQERLEYYRRARFIPEMVGKS